MVSWQLLSPLAGLVLAVASAAQCKRCVDSGSEECKKHGKALALEVGLGLIECSVAQSCKTCRGGLELVCKKCESVAAKNRIDKRIERARAWRASLAGKIDPHVTGKNVMHLKTTNVDLTFSIRPMTIGRSKVDSHRLMHMYGDRIEAVRKLFVETFDLGVKDPPARLRIFMFEDRGDHRSLAPRVAGGAGGSAGTGMKWMGVESVYCMYRHRSMTGDDALHSNIVHNVTHLLMANMLPERWLGNLKCGWIDAGVAHWVEMQVFGRCRTFCFEEVLIKPGTNYKGGRWRGAVRQLVETGKIAPFAEIYQKNTDQLELEHHAQSFAYVDFLISTRGGKSLADLLRAVKSGKRMREALQAVYGLNPLTFEDKFQAWVKEHYPRK